jgi:hypothetical protein
MWAAPPVDISVVIFGDGVFRVHLLVGARLASNCNPPDFSLQGSRITGVSHQHSANHSTFKNQK